MEPLNSLDLADDWGPAVSCPDHCVHPVAVSVGRIPAAWGRRLERELQSAGVLHWKISKTPYLPWLPQHAIAMMVIRHVDGSEDLADLCQELRQIVGGVESRGMVFVVPNDRMECQWLLREHGALDVRSLESRHAPRVAGVVQRFFERHDWVHPDNAVPACWLAPTRQSLQGLVRATDR